MTLWINGDWVTGQGALRVSGIGRGVMARQ